MYIKIVERIDDNPFSVANFVFFNFGDSILNTIHILNNIFTIIMLYCVKLFECILL